VIEYKSIQRATARLDPARREEENEQRHTRREQPGVLAHESIQRATAREQPGVLTHESIQRATARERPGVLAHESIQRTTAREQPGVLAHEARQRRMANVNKHVVMATKFVNGEYLFHQPCGSWDQECVHGCGYLHLSSSTAGTRKKCCANGRLSSVSGNFDEELMMKHELQQFPSFMRNIVTWSTNFSQKSSIYNNLVAMAGTVVCNYSDLNGWLRRGPGDQCVFMNGRVHHYMRIASSTAQNCGVSYFIFDDIASLAGSADAQNVNPKYCWIFAKVSGKKIHIAMNYDFLEQLHENAQKALL
jgi:hypothetical protein